MYSLKYTIESLLKNARLNTSKFINGAAPAAPQSGEIIVYSKADKKLYFKDDTGLESGVGGGGTIPLTTKGDLFGFDTAGNRIPIGTNGQVLTVDSAQALGLKWAEQDGWIDDSGETWVYASANTFTITGDKTGKYQKSDKIKLTQTTVKYFYIISVVFAAGTTTITVTAGTDYSLANAAITAPFHSKTENPQGFPGAFNFTPTYTGFSTNPAAVTCRFSILGNICTMSLVEGTDGTSNSTAKSLSLPVAKSAGGSTAILGTVIDNGVQSYGKHLISAGASVTASYPTVGGVWTASGACRLAPNGTSFIYEI